MAFYSEQELQNMGFKYLGRGVKISDKASIYNAANITVGDDSRIDDFCVLSAGQGGISIGKNVHIAVFCSLIGKELIEIADFVGLSARVSIYSNNDDYSGEYMSNPTVPIELTNVTYAPVKIQKHVLIGAGSIVLPGVTIGQGAAVGAMSLVNSDCKEFMIYLGVPAKPLKPRSKRMLELEQAISTKK